MSKIKLNSPFRNWSSNVLKVTFKLSTEKMELESTTTRSQMEGFEPKLEVGIY